MHSDLLFISLFLTAFFLQCSGWSFYLTYTWFMNMEPGVVEDIILYVASLGRTYTQSHYAAVRGESKRLLRPMSQ